MDPNSATEKGFRTQFGEIEDGFVSSAYARACENESPPATSVDVLEVALNGEQRSTWLPDLNHDGLTRHLAKQADIKATNRPFLRILFLNVKRTRGGNRVILASPATLKFLRSHFAIPLVYLDVLGPMQWGANPGNACYDRGDNDGTVEGMYHFSADSSPCNVWYSRRKRTQSTLYILSNCADKARDLLLHCASGKDYQSLFRPMVIDAILADSAAERYKWDLQDSRDVLLQYERHGASHLPNEPVSETFQKLHRLSQKWHILNEDLVNLEEALTFVLHIHKTYESSRLPSQPNASRQGSIDDAKLSTDFPELAPNHETINYLLTRNNSWKRWVSNYNTRTQIRINLHFNLASQTDNKTNQAIASTSKTIAEATLRDSSSMITIATMTMIFLPGTFVSAILSMSVFDNSGTDAQGRPTLKVLPQWWIFPVATVLLTGFVVSVWRIWQLRRLKRSLTTAEMSSKTSEDRADDQVGVRVEDNIDGKTEMLRLRRLVAKRPNDQLAPSSRVLSTFEGSTLEEQMALEADNDPGVRNRRRSAWRDFLFQKSFKTGMLGEPKSEKIRS